MIYKDCLSLHLSHLLGLILIILPTLLMGNVPLTVETLYIPASKQQAIKIIGTVHYPPELPDDINAYVEELAKVYIASLSKNRIIQDNGYAFPIETPSMKLGNVGTTTLAQPLFQWPLFLLGSDELSRQWLKQHKPLLIELNAIGWLIEVENEQAFNTIKQIANELLIVPMSAETLVEVLPVKYYPVVIEQDKVWQSLPESSSILGRPK